MTSQFEKDVLKVGENRAEIRDQDAILGQTMNHLGDKITMTYDFSALSQSQEMVFLYLPQLFRRFALSSILIASFACAVIRLLALGWFAQALWVIVLPVAGGAAPFVPSFGFQASQQLPTLEHALGRH